SILAYLQTYGCHCLVDLSIEKCISRSQICKQRDFPLNPLPLTVKQTFIKCPNASLFERPPKVLPMYFSIGKKLLITSLMIVAENNSLATVSMRLANNRINWCLPSC